MLSLLPTHCAQPPTALKVFLAVPALVRKVCVDQRPSTIAAAVFAVTTIVFDRIALTHLAHWFAILGFFLVIFYLHLSNGRLQFGDCGLEPLVRSREQIDALVGRLTRSHCTAVHHSGS